jgi:hypothetical protein
MVLSIFGGGYESFRLTPTIATLLSIIETLVFWSWMLILWDSYDKNFAKAKL